VITVQQYAVQFMRKERKQTLRSEMYVSFTCTLYTKHTAYTQCIQCALCGLMLVAGCPSVHLSLAHQLPVKLSPAAETQLLE